MRRLSALVALLALSRFSLSGADVGCASPSGATEQHRHGSATTTASAAAGAHDDHGADASGGDTECANAEHDSCLSMSCVNAALPDAWVQAPDISAPQRVTVGVNQRAFELARAPEPPPPRV